MADDRPSQNPPDRSPERRSLGPVVWTPIGKAWLETLIALALAEDAAEAAADGRSAPAASDLDRAPIAPNVPPPALARSQSEDAPRMTLTIP